MIAMAENENKPKIVTLEILEYFFAKLKAKFVVQEAGKGLSSNDFTAELKKKLDSIVTGDGDEYVTTEDIDNIFEDEEQTEEAGAGEGETSGDGNSLNEE